MNNTLIRPKKTPVIRLDNSEYRLDSSANCKRALHHYLQHHQFKGLSTYSDSISQTLRTDSRAVGIFGRTLELFLQEEVRRRKPVLNADVLIPTEVRNLWGIREVNTPYIENAGKVTYGEGTSDIGYSSVTVRYEGVKLTKMRMGIQWTETDLDYDFQQQQSSVSSGLSLVEENIRNALEIFDETYHRDAVYGIPSQGIEGLFTDSRSPDNIYTTFFPYAESRANLYNWIKELPNVVSKNAGRFLKPPNSLLMPKSFMYKLMDISDTTDVDMTAYDLLRRNMADLGITNMLSMAELDQTYLEQYGVFPANSDQELIKIYNNDSSCLRRYVSPIRINNPLVNQQEEYKGHIKQVISSIDNYYPKETLDVIYPTTLS